MDATMPTYTFVTTQHIVLEAGTDIEADTIQAAMAELARRSQTTEGLAWGTGPDGDQPYCILRSISRDGARIPGFEDPYGSKDPVTWMGLGGVFDVEDLPEELGALRG
jgi:hypothetical protein